jgi:hypothetical protein
VVIYVSPPNKPNPASYDYLYQKQELHFPSRYYDKSQAAPIDGSRNSKDPVLANKHSQDISSLLELSPTSFFTQKAQTEKEQIQVLLKQLTELYSLGKKHGETFIEDELRLENLLNCVSDPLRSASVGMQRGELEKLLLSVKQSRMKDEVECWRDKQRLLTQIMYHWSEYRDEERKLRLFNFDL